MKPLNYLETAYRVMDRIVIGALLLLAMILLGAQSAHATEIVPSLGISRAVDSDNDQAKMYGGLAVRSDLMPFVMGEIGAAYRTEERFNGDLKIRQWPVTGSLYLKPLPMLYAGAGVGWYQTTLDYSESSGIKDETTQKFGVHVGGGVQMPLAPALGLDLNGRYVHMQKQESRLVPQKFDPTFWTTSIGLAIKF